MKLRLLLALILALTAILPGVTHAQAVSHDWTNWISGTISPPFVTGTVNGQVITFSGTGTILSAQTGLTGQPMYWTPSTTYIGGSVTNPPVTSDVIRLVGPGTYTITFAQPVTNPVMAVLSLGGIAVMNFDFGAQPFTILNTGPGSFAPVRLPLTQVGNVLSGWEAYGVIQFAGTLTTLTFTMPVAENWTGFTIGVPVTVVPVVVEPPVVVPPPAPTGTVNLAWDLVVATPEMPIDANRIYRGFDTACTAVAPLTELVGSTVYPTTVFTDANIPLVGIRVCYEATSVNIVGESAHSNRANALIGKLLPTSPLNLRVTSQSTP